MTFEDFCIFASRLEFAGVEFIPDLSPNLPEELTGDRRKKLVQIGQELGLSYTVHNIFYDINHTSLVPRVREFALTLTEDVLKFASDIGAVGFVIHPGYRFAAWRSKQEQIVMFERVVQQVYPALTSLSASYHVPIFMENGNYFLSAKSGKRNPLHIGIEAAELVDLVETSNPVMGICFDVGKAYFSMNDYSIDELIEYLSHIYPYVREIHLNAFDGYLEAVPPVFDWLSNNKYEGLIIFECGKSAIEPLKEITNSYFD